ncbi:hypothetical protein B0T25DRAFT_561779 [Lasiosphaeria hispida]|uniref:Uncharacterized protein n=1 Tax=Lasiosphaeria hispida TaxID=260671 RepID=A0AAJ0MJF0_9PEZI|nr:hypothetical protein B0T25DRAFT_561779 [Lasiosphaeria hispida]
MAPNDVQSRHGDGRPRQRGRASDTAAPSDAASPQRRNEGQPITDSRHVSPSTPLTRSESWVEVASQPSSSSLSSIGDEIVTTGLRVGNNSYPPRRRRLQQPLPMPPSLVVGHAAAQAGTSSQEEYDETESEEDRLMTSSTEQVHCAASLPRQQTAVRAGVDTDTDSDDDENATALGRPSSSPTFRPQPNAFSHPPSHLTHRHSTSSAHPHHFRPSMSQRSHTRPHRSSPDYLSPSFQADNDAALRASLTTLLSCAAAARGLPKKDDSRAAPSATGGIGAGVGVLPSSQPMELRLVPESELMAEVPPTAPPGRRSGPTKVLARTASNSSAPSAPSATSSASSRDPNLVTEKSKRAAAPQSKPSRATKKKRTGVSSSTVDNETATFISPTLLTWVVSAGVVVLVSVVGFGAGYVIGREVGRQEGAMGLGAGASATSNASASCGRELVKSTSGGTLRRFRWGSVGRSITA